MAWSKAADPLHGVEAEKRTTTAEENRMPQHLPSDAVDVVATLLVEGDVSLEGAHSPFEGQTLRLDERNSIVRLQGLQCAFKCVTLRMPVGIEKVHVVDSLRLQVSTDQLETSSLETFISLTMEKDEVRRLPNLGRDRIAGLSGVVTCGASPVPLPSRATPRPGKLA
jgi:hypothetical protein